MQAGLRAWAHPCCLELDCQRGRAPLSPRPVPWQSRGSQKAPEGSQGLSQDGNPLALFLADPPTSLESCTQGVSFVVEGLFTPSSGRSQGHPVSARSSRAIHQHLASTFREEGGAGQVPGFCGTEPEAVDGAAITDDPTDKDPDFQDGREKV